MEKMTAEEFLADFAPNVVSRLDDLDEHAKRVEGFLFTDTPERPSFETMARKVDQHVDVLCDYATTARKVLHTVMFIFKWVGIVSASLGALFGLLHTYGLGLAYAQGINETGSFSDYVRTVLTSRRMAQLVVMVGFGLLGIAANWFWKWVTNQIEGSLWRYLVIDHPKRTLASLAAYVGWVFGVAFPSEMVTDLSAWTAVINLALTTGFAIDVVANKSTRAEWTPAERAAKAAGPIAAPAPKEAG